MRITRLMMIMAIGVFSAARSATATAYINFIEGPTETSLVNITYTGWDYNSVGVDTSEVATFRGLLYLGNIGNGTFNILLYEPNSTVLSDYVHVAGTTGQDATGRYFTVFDFTFASDTEGTVLSPPAPGTKGDVSATETGQLQVFPLDGLPIQIGIQSDLESVSVPDGGMTILLLGAAISGLGIGRWHLRGKSAAA